MHLEILVMRMVVRGGGVMGMSAIARPQCYKQNGSSYILWLKVVVEPQVIKVGNYVRFELGLSGVQNVYLEVKPSMTRTVH